MIYAYRGNTSIDGDWLIEGIEADTLEEAKEKFKLLKAKYSGHFAAYLVGGSSIELIETAYAGKIHS